MAETDLRPVGDIYPLPDNPRHGDIGAISESLRRFGQQKPIVVNSEGIVLAGNHTYHAALALGWTEIWVVESELEGSEQTGFSLADNRLSDLATYDHEILLSQLSMLDTLDGTGYDAEYMDDLKHTIDEPLTFEQFLESDARVDRESGDHQIVCPNCSHSFAWRDRAKPST